MENNNDLDSALREAIQEAMIDFDWEVFRENSLFFLQNLKKEYDAAMALESAA